MDIDIEFSNCGLQHINKLYYHESECLFDAKSYLLE
jgi:hypothetical protein